MASVLTSLSSTRWLRGSPSSTTKKPSLFTWEQSPVQKGYDLPDRTWGHTEGLGGSVRPHTSMQPVPSTGTGQCCAHLLVKNSSQALTLLGWQSQTLIEVQAPNWSPLDRHIRGTRPLWERPAVVYSIPTARIQVSWVLAQVSTEMSASRSIRTS